MNTYEDRDGNRYTKGAIDRKTSDAKKRKLESFMDEWGYFFCEDCGRSSGVYLDCSHNISVDRCQKEGHVEDAWDVGNITIRCRDCHRIHDKM